MQQPLKSKFETYLAAETILEHLTDEALDVPQLERLVQLIDEIKVWLESEIVLIEKRAAEASLVEVA